MNDVFWQVVIVSLLITAVLRIIGIRSLWPFTYFQDTCPHCKKDIYPNGSMLSPTTTSLGRGPHLRPCVGDRLRVYLMNGCMAHIPELIHDGVVTRIIEQKLYPDNTLVPYVVVETGTQQVWEPLNQCFYGDSHDPSFVGFVRQR